MTQRPGADPLFTRRTPRVAAAIKLHKRKERDERGLFLAEGPQAVRSALAANAVRELFVTPERYGDFERENVRISLVNTDALEALTETVAPQGVVAVCAPNEHRLDDILARSPRLIAVAVEVRDPGNAGTILRTADAAGADAVVFAGEAVDPYNGKCVRASAGSVFHLPIVRPPKTLDLFKSLARAGLTTLATTGYGDADLDTLIDSGRLAGPTAWLFGSEAHGLPADALERADARVRVPIYGGAESLNLAAAAAICLYASARAQRP